MRAGECELSSNVYSMPAARATLGDLYGSRLSMKIGGLGCQPAFTGATGTGKFESIFGKAKGGAFPCPPPSDRENSSRPTTPCWPASSSPDQSDQTARPPGPWPLSSPPTSGARGMSAYGRQPSMATQRVLKRCARTTAIAPSRDLITRERIMTGIL
jgi:hypothetical protein